MNVQQKPDGDFKTCHSILARRARMDEAGRGALKSVQGEKTPAEKVLEKSQDL